MSVNKIRAIGHLGANSVVRTLRSGRKVVPSGIGSLLWEAWIFPSAF
jgi:hypothetical protein